MLFNNVPTRFAMITGKYQMSGGCTDVVGGAMTVGIAVSAVASAHLSWEPAFISTPVILATILSGMDTTSGQAVRLTGIAVSSAGITLGQSPVSDVTIGLLLIGEAKL